MVKKLLIRFISFMSQVLGYIPALIYSYIYSEYFTKATYQRIAERCAGKSFGRVLDVGTATGQPLLSIVETFKGAEVLGIDIDKNYVPACQKLFREHKNVTIQLMNYYDVETVFAGKTFDLIIFGSSFMLMPDQVKAIEIAKARLSKNGRIYFLLTLYDGKTLFNRFMEKLKPYLKYMTTVDFGKVTYKADFESFLVDHGLNATLKERSTGNQLLKYFKFYIYEAEKAA